MREEYRKIVSDINMKKIVSFDVFDTFGVAQIRQIFFIT